MKICVTGGSGFVGSYLIPFLLDKGHSVVVMGTSSKSPFMHLKNVIYVSTDTTKEGDWQSFFQDVDVVINLTGKTIFHYWTKSYKEKIYDSRIQTTRNIVNALPKDRKVVFLSTSAIGYYGSQGDTVLSEGMPAGNDFLAHVCMDWEKEALAAASDTKRVLLMRFGVILGENGGALKQMVPAYKFFVGGPLGDGKHWFPWIHIKDLLKAILFLIDHPEAPHGAINFCAPNSLTNNTFSKALANSLNRPAFFRVPAFILRMFAGELGSVLLSSQRAKPEKLLNYGFTFQYPKLEHALAQIVSKK